MTVPKECRTCDKNINHHPELKKYLTVNQQSDVVIMLCGDCQIESGPGGGEELRPVTVYDLPDMPPITCPVTGQVVSQKFTHDELNFILEHYTSDIRVSRDNASVQIPIHCPHEDCPVPTCPGVITMHYNLTQVQSQGQAPDIDLLEDLGMVNHVRLSGAALDSHLKGKNPHKLYFPA